VPKYRETGTDGAPGEAAQVPFGMHDYPVRFIEQTVAKRVTAVLIDAPALYDRAGLYGDANGEFGDNVFRFAVLCRGALEYARIRGRRPSVVHAHDWQGGLAPVYVRTVLRDDPVIGGVRTVLTIHNLAFQGGFDPRELTWIGLGQDLYTPQLLEFYGRASGVTIRMSSRSGCPVLEVLFLRGARGFAGVSTGGVFAGTVFFAIQPSIMPR
jgi:starch synthase